MKKFIPIAGWLSLLLGFAALFFYIVLPDLKTVIFSLTAVSISNGIFFLVSEGSSLKKFFSSRSALHGTNAIILTSVFLGILIFVNLLIHRHKQRFDLTEGNLFTLSPQTKKFISDRFAVIGDAAVGMHPVTAHGFNLGLKGLDILSTEIKSADKKKIDIGTKDVLKNYQFKLHRAAAPVYFATNGIINLFTSNILPAKLTRQFILRFVNIVKPVKQGFLNILK